MATITADVDPDTARIRVYTKTSDEEFSMVLAACKRVGGARFASDETGKYWHYPMSVDTCHGLRRAFGEELRITRELASWYRSANVEATAQKALAAGLDADLTHVEKKFAEWLRGYQRAGAQWISRGYRGCGLVADTPGVGKTPETLAALVEGRVSGPVLVVCPRVSVRAVWGTELARHLPGVPVYLAWGTRARREKVLAQFANDMRVDPDALRVVVVVAEMLRVEKGDPCYTDGGTKISGMCPQRWKNADWSCGIHTTDPKLLLKMFGLWQDQRMIDKAKVPVAFAYPELFQSEMLGGGWSWIILDESHKLLGSLTVKGGNLMAEGLKKLPERARRRYALSGTPFGKGGRVQGMFGTLHWLWPDEYTSFWRWAGEWFEIEEKVINRAGKTVKKILGLKGTNSHDDSEQAMEDFLKTLGPRILRRTKAEVLPQLEPKTYVEVPCAMTTKQAKQYSQLMVDAEVITPNGPVTANGALALLTRERQVANGEITKSPDTDKVQFTGHSGKVDQLWEALSVRGILEGAPGPKLVIASEFNEFIDVVLARLREEKVPHYRFDGRTSEAGRKAQVDAWQANEKTPARPWSRSQQCVGLVPRVMVVNSLAAGISINLDAADEMHCLDERWNPEENEQLEDRIHRASRDHKVTIFYYRTEGSIDYSKAHSVEAKRRAQHAVLDGSRGLAYVREMMAAAFLNCEVED